ncbi:hypothetical protein K438DRAFT_1764911 [Mycena galopus ATCC 62051]|nr:hypothetical protein K438DRAFT_1764911 [Mycena galopus ATCC 62051]
MVQWQSTIIMFEHHIASKTSLQSGAPAARTRTCSIAMNEDQKILHVQQEEMCATHPGIRQFPERLRSVCNEQPLDKSIVVQLHQVSFIIRHQKIDFYSFSADSVGIRREAPCLGLAHIDTRDAKSARGRGIMSLECSGSRQDAKGVKRHDDATIWRLIRRPGCRDRSQGSNWIVIGGLKQKVLSNELGARIIQPAGTDLGAMGAKNYSIHSALSRNLTDSKCKTQRGAWITDFLPSLTREFQQSNHYLKSWTSVTSRIGWPERDVTIPTISQKLMENVHAPPPPGFLPAGSVLTTGPFIQPPPPVFAPNLNVSKSGHSRCAKIRQYSMAVDAFLQDFAAVAQLIHNLFESGDRIQHLSMNCQ